MHSFLKVCREEQLSRKLGCKHAQDPVATSSGFQFWSFSSVLSFCTLWQDPLLIALPLFFSSSPSRTWTSSWSWSPPPSSSRSWRAPQTWQQLSVRLLSRDFTSASWECWPWNISWCPQSLEPADPFSPSSEGPKTPDDYVNNRQKSIIQEPGRWCQCPGAWRRQGPWRRGREGTLQRRGWGTIGWHTCASPTPHVENAANIIPQFNSPHGDVDF